MLFIMSNIVKLCFLMQLIEVMRILKLNLTDKNYACKPKLKESSK